MADWSRRGEAYDRVLNSAGFHRAQSRCHPTQPGYMTKLLRRPSFMLSFAEYVRMAFFKVPVRESQGNEDEAGNRRRRKSR